MKMNIYHSDALCIAMFTNGLFYCIDFSENSEFYHKFQKTETFVISKQQQTEKVEKHKCYVEIFLELALYKSTQGNGSINKIWFLATP